MDLILIILILLLLFGGGFGYRRYGHRGGIGIGGLLLLILVLYLIFGHRITAMKYALSGTAIAAALVVAVPVWAQTSADPVAALEPVLTDP